MIKAVFVALFGSALLAAAWSTSAEASDFCLQQTSKPELSFVLKNFKMPRRGKCAQFGGWCANCVNDDMLTGNACTFSDGTEVRFGFQTSPMAIGPVFNYSENWAFSLNTSSLTGTFVNRQLIYAPGGASGTTLTGPANGGTCHPAIVPFPFH